MATLREELEHILSRDPAARSMLEVALTYPGFHAVLWHKAAHWLWNKGAKLPAKLVSTLSRFLTGVEIHPAAVIGEKLFIDHGFGVVIGETSIIGRNVTIYHGVTLGGVSLEHRKRHPTVEDDVIIGAGAQVLGPITVGKGARVGANSVVVKDVAPNATVAGIPARAIATEHADFTAYGTPLDTRDPLQAQLDSLRSQLAEMELKIRPKEGGGSGI